MDTLTESDLVSFGNYLLEDRTRTFPGVSLFVTHADLENWKELKGEVQFLETAKQTTLGTFYFFEHKFPEDDRWIVLINEQQGKPSVAMTDKDDDEWEYRGKGFTKWAYINL